MSHPDLHGLHGAMAIIVVSKPEGGPRKEGRANRLPTKQPQQTGSSRAVPLAVSAAGLPPPHAHRDD
jgi:hypothetical protein